MTCCFYGKKERKKIIPIFGAIGNELCRNLCYYQLKNESRRTYKNGRESYFPVFMDARRSGRDFTGGDREDRGVRNQGSLRGSAPA